VAHDPPETGADGSDWRLHCQDSAESSLVLRHAIVCLRCLCQRVRLHDRFNFSLRYEIKRFEMRSISETEIGSASAPIVTSRPSGRNPCTLSDRTVLSISETSSDIAPRVSSRRFLFRRCRYSAPRSLDLIFNGNFRADFATFLRVESVLPN
jgi:hypothetical protein